ncbi:MAG: TetR family transcriptional regulator [Lachnospiraceae bacterium]|nr:TetR family transcriptional regulator [Lachnospiraceae bacterium]
MKTGKEDLRVIKTKQNIRSAFMELMKKQPLEKIRVNDICDKALCSRNTFYQHYIDKYELFEQICLECIAELDTAFSVENMDITVNNTLGYGRDIIFAVETKKEEMKNLLLYDDRGYLRNQLYTAAVQKCFEGSLLLAGNNNIDKTEIALNCHYLVSGIIGFVMYWLQFTDLSADEAATLLAKVNSPVAEYSMSLLGDYV